MRKPDAICTGTQKAGTSWLFETMAERPDVCTLPLCQKPLLIKST